MTEEQNSITATSPPQEIHESRRIPDPEPTPIDSIPNIVQDLRTLFKTGKTLSLNWRKAQLQALIDILTKHEQDWIDAMAQDMGSHMFEAELLIGNVRSEIKHTIDNLSSWAKPTKLSHPMALMPGSSRDVPEPYGVVLDFIPYNYPMYLGFSTLIPILAAGNVCLFKPSSNTPACSRLYQTHFSQYLEGVKVVCGPTSICDAILQNRFDFIFYTGSPRVAKNIMTAAAQYLTPVLLELGGKSPVYVDKEVKLDVCARRLVHGKIFNGGQTCVAPDYVLCHEAVFDKFVEKVKNAVIEQYGDVTQYNKDITHIINDRHFDRLVNAITTSGGQIVIEGARIKESLFIGPTVIVNPALDSQLMQEEIFGPIIPIIKIQSMDAAIDFINDREKPLALYVMTSNSSVQEAFTQRTSSGALLINDVVFHVAAADVPFGGVGNSGMGRYHGEAGFRSLSHMKPVLTHSTAIEIASQYAPYTDDKLKFVMKFV